MQPRLHCSHWHAQDSCSFLGRQLLHMKHTENFGVKRPHSVNRLCKQNTGFFERALLLRIRSPLHHLKSGSGAALKHLIEGHFGSPSSRAQFHESSVQSNTSEPRRKPCTTLKTI